MSHRRRALAALTCAAVLALHTAPAWAAGVARVLTDEELDATYAQGLSIVNMSLHLPRIANGFDFNFTSETRIDVPASASGRTSGGARVDFLGGLMSVAADAAASPAGSGPSRRTIDLGRGTLSFAVQSSGTAGAGQPAGGGVSITFGGTAPQGISSLIGITARDAIVDTRAQMAVGVNPGAQAALQSAVRAGLLRQIRGVLGASP